MGERPTARQSLPESASLRKIYDEKFLRFVLVGISNFVISFAVFHLLLLLKMTFPFRTAAIQLVSYAAGTAWSYFWNRRFTFRSTSPALPQATRFVGLQIALALVSTLLIGLVVDVLGFSPTPSWFVVMGVITVTNFVLCRWWAFR